MTVSELLNLLATKDADADANIYVKLGNRAVLIELAVIDGDDDVILVAEPEALRARLGMMNYSGEIPSYLTVSDKANKDAD